MSAIWCEAHVGLSEKGQGRWDGELKLKQENYKLERWTLKLWFLIRATSSSCSGQGVNASLILAAVGHTGATYIFLHSWLFFFKPGSFSLRRSAVSQLDSSWKWVTTAGLGTWQSEGEESSPDNTISASSWKVACQGFKLCLATFEAVSNSANFQQVFQFKIQNSQQLMILKPFIYKTKTFKMKLKDLPL